MFNKEIYSTEPTPTSILNDGVVDVVAGKDDVLKYELRTFVCEGKYEDGLTKVLGNFCRCFGKPTMPAVWISGFYGSGKSHLVKMLAQLWANTPLSDGSRPRDLANLPQSVKDLLAELDTLGKQNGGLRAATGTLHGESTDDMKMAILKTVFRSVGLPESYPQAKFVLWLRHEGKEQEIRQRVQDQGGDWSTELRNLNVSQKIHKALCEVFPATFPTPKECGVILIKTFPTEKSVSDTDFKATFNDAIKENGKIPLTLVVMDEVQQYIGNNDDRVASVQSAVQACTKAMDSRIMLVATGQSALNGTTMLQKIKDRFAVEIQLQDMDITSVVRNVVLRKKPEVKADIEKVLTADIGEISKHLPGTPFAYSAAEDKDCLAADYPILPSRRRFWEKVLLALDVGGTDGQLRNLLKMNRDFAAENGKEKLGTVVAADELFFAVATRLENSGLMSREFYTEVMRLLKDKDADKQLAARACGLVFLINKLVDHNPTLGIQATADTLADLMVSDLNTGSAALRKNLPTILDACPILQKLGDTYHVQTKESADWTRQFNAEVAALKSGGSAEIDTARFQQFNAGWSALSIKPYVLQGVSKTKRDVQLYMNKTPPASAVGELALVVANDWYLSKKDVKSAAAAAGTASSHVWVYVPNTHANDLRNHLIEMLAAEKTIAKRPTPSTPDGKQARSAIETKRANAEESIRALVQAMFESATVYQGGGTEVTTGLTLAERINAAETVAADRLYSDFGPSDNLDWGKVWTDAHKGNPGAFAAIGHVGDVKSHPIAAKILSSIGTGKKGEDIRKALSEPPYGWTKDAIDGTLGTLLVCNEIAAYGPDGKRLVPTQIERKQFGTVEFRIDVPVLTPKQQIDLRKFFQTVLGKTVNKDELSSQAPALLDAMEKTAGAAGGDGPLPERPDTAFIDDLRALSGNEQLVKIHSGISGWESKISDWKATAGKIAARIGAWQELEKLAVHAAKMPSASAKSLCTQVDAIRAGRQLLDNPDPVPPVAKDIADLLRAELEKRKTAYKAATDAGEARLAADPDWGKLTPEQRDAIRQKHGLVTGNLELTFDTALPADILDAFASYTLEALDDKIAALKPKYDAMLADAAKELMPKIQSFTFPSATLTTEAEIDSWIATVSAKLKAMLPSGPVKV